MSAATVADVAVVLGRPISTSDEVAQVQWWLDGVELVIASRLGPVDDLEQPVLRYVEAESVAAKVRRSGTAESSITVAVDDGTVTRRYENSVSAGDITDDLWHLLDADIGSGVFSARPYFEPDITTPWLDWS